MGLILIPTPIGNAQDLSFRAKEILQASPVIIVEEFKESSVWLRAHGITGKQLERLNEHSTAEDVTELSRYCLEQNVVLVSDCGTPSFCDPGFQLVQACRKENIKIQSSLGASSLMGLISLSSERIHQFYFRGFIPAENIAREKEWQTKNAGLTAKQIQVLITGALVTIGTEKLPFKANEFENGIVKACLSLTNL